MNKKNAAIYFPASWSYTKMFLFLETRGWLKRWMFEHRQRLIDGDHTVWEWRPWKP